MAATRNDWKAAPLPTARTSITFDRTYSADEFARIQEGHVPQRMEDKWFAFYEEPWLYLHRSWTGYAVYQVRFESVDGGGRVADVLVSRDSEQYRSTDGAFDALVLAIVLDGYAGRDTQAALQQFKLPRA